MDSPAIPWHGQHGVLSRILSFLIQSSIVGTKEVLEVLFCHHYQHVSSYLTCTEGQGALSSPTVINLLKFVYFY